MEVVPDHLVAHVVDAKQMPGIVANLYILAVKVRVGPFCKKFYMEDEILSSVCTFNSG
jgi:hypothetical protein